MKKVADILFDKDLLTKEHLLNCKVNKKWLSYSGRDFYKYAFGLAEFMLQQGLHKNDKILLISENRPEWNFTDFASQLIGVITIPVFPNISEYDLQFILNDSQPKYLFFSTEKLWKKYQNIFEKHFQNKILSFNKIPNIPNIHQVVKKINLQDIEAKIKQIYQSIQPSDWLTILYTSGTSGNPKGVILTHANLVSNILNCQHIAPFQKHWKALSFLPLNHVYERMVNSLLLYKQVSIYYAESIETVVDNIREVKPHLFVSVPRLLERVYQKITSTRDSMKGYGLTETSPVVAVNEFNDDGKCISTVGPVIPNTQVKIAEDGEILVKGPGVMLGYYNNEASTKEVIDSDGWFHTGDIGEFVNGKFLKITDRKKEIFKTTSGKYISPAYIENKLKEFGLIEHVAVIGANEKFPSALITLNAQNVYQKFPAKKNLNIQTLSKDKEIHQEINQFIHQINKQLAPHEQIRNPQILDTTWSVESGELTPKMSLKRKFINEKYKQVIDKIYRKDNED